MSILGSAGGMCLNAASCFMRSNTVPWTQMGRVLMSQMGIHGLSLTAFRRHIILGEEGGKSTEEGKSLGDCSLEGQM